MIKYGKVKNIETHIEVTIKFITVKGFKLKKNDETVTILKF